MAQIRNKKLYDFIVENYIKAEKPVTQQEIVDTFGMSMGALKNFMYRHNLNKKDYYSRVRKQIYDYDKKGLNTREISKLMNVTQQYVSYILGERWKR